jgi:hypothetical protein
LERVATLAGTVADGFEKGADLLEEMAGTRLGGPTAERTTEDAGQRLADAVGSRHDARPPGGLAVVQGLRGPTPRLCRTRRHGWGARRQGEGGTSAEGRMAYVGMVCNPGPEWPWPDEKPTPMRAR